MQKVRLIFNQALLISVGMMVVVGIMGCMYHIQGEEFVLPWYLPFSLLACGVACALPTLLLVDDGLLGRFPDYLRKIIHFITVLLVVSVFGYVFKWYADISEYISIMMSYVVIYFVVWIVTLLLYRQEAQQINQALNNIRDEE